MKIGYYPGCTLKTKAKNLEDSALAALRALDVEVEELERWNCCGAVFSLADDDLIHQVAPVRDLIRAHDAGCDQVMTLCSQCYNVLARANKLVRDDEEKRKTLNAFMDEESDYAGEVEVVHYLDLLREQVGWEKLRSKLKQPLDGLKVAAFHGCTLLRPKEVAVGEGDGPVHLMQDFLTALGATPVAFGAQEDCCGAYEVLANPEAGLKQSGRVLESALRAGVDALALSCPLCEYNLGKRQPDARALVGEIGELPVLYFTQLLAVALGLEDEVNRFELNMASVPALLQDKQLLASR